MNKSNSLETMDKTVLSEQKKFRLSEIIGIENYFYQEINQRKSCSKKFNKYVTNFDYIDKILIVLSFFYFLFFSIWVFFHEHSRFTGQQGKGEGIYLTPLYHFHPLHRHLDISRAITAESSPLHIAGSRTRTGNLWFPSASR